MMEWPSSASRSLVGLQTSILNLKPLDNMNLYWIDDEYEIAAKRRVPTGAGKREIESGLKADLKVQLFKNSSEYGAFIAELPVSSTYGVLMDYQLTNVGEKNKVEYGTTWAAQLRAQKPSIPIIGLSSEDGKKIPKFRMENFLAFYKRNELVGAKPHLVGELFSLFEGYRSLCAKWKSQKGAFDLNHFMKQLHAPDPITDLLRVTIPEELRSLWDEETPHAASRWVWHQLLGVAGYVFDEIEAATYLGLTESAFLEFKKNKYFQAAQYIGVFACDVRPRWWICKMRSAVEAILDDEVMGPVSHSRDELLGALEVPKKAREHKFARAYGHKGRGLIPECVVFPDQDSKNQGYLDKRVPALLRDSVVDESDANPPFGFQSPRHFKLNTEK